MKSVLIKEGLCTCQEEPRCRGGLEGYNMGEEYRYQLRAHCAPIKHGKEYVRVYHPEGNYYETCGTGDFKKYFVAKTGVASKLPQVLISTSEGSRHEKTFPLRRARRHAVHACL